MVNIFGVYKPLLRWLMKLVVMRPQTVEIKPGTVMNFWVPNETPNKSKNSNNNKAVVFIHGFAADGIITWQSQVLALARKYKVYVPDLLFFGGSITDRSERSPEFQAECVAKGLKKPSVERCTLVGLSYGGMVGFKMAEMYPDLVESMVLTCSAMALTKSISDAALERIGFKSWSDYTLPDSVQGVKILFDIATFKLPCIPNFVYKHYLEAIGTPCGMIVITGNLGDRATLQYIEKAGHLVGAEQPCVYNKHLKEILTTLLEDGHQKQRNL
ncbi:uncharacterized protein LOC111999398 [Quercus suber]|uniref:AB hydrolase-1 domain-containing protein n=1 Tax=Quercus suber TaxID=58331 RepID=A0AAW0ING0_QUESU|nr:uncharacterized protein LOC111999398 [Quercus suber]